MKKLILCAACLVGLIGLTYFLGTAQGQSRTAGAAAAPAGPTRIALIDLKVVFQDYTKFTRLREELKHQLEEKETEMRAMVAEMKKLSDTLKSKTIKPDSPEFIAKEKELTQMAANLEAYKKQTQMELSRVEAGNYQKINQEINEMSAKVAKKFGYSLVMRFSRDDLNSTDPTKVAQALNRQILYYNENDDISDKVVYYLNYYDKDNRPAKSGNGTDPKQTGN